jgi:hypothetical protein
VGDGKAYYFDTSLNPVKAAVAKAIVGVIGNAYLKVIRPGNVPWPVAKKAMVTSNHDRPQVRGQ